MTRWLTLLLPLLLGACGTLSQVQREQVQQVVVDARDTHIDCDRPAACAEPSALRNLANAAASESQAEQPRHYAMVLDYGQDALLARINLIRSATTAIDLQTFIFDEDDAGHLVLDELIIAARRGVRVRVLIDQLSALRRVETLAALAATHQNFELRIYNPMLNRARINYPMYALAAACCWRRLNQRMHSKLLLVDGAIAITGGRNYQDKYFDWDENYNFRDRDLLLAGAEVRQMALNFAKFWDAPLTRRPEHLTDVGKYLLANGAPMREHGEYDNPERVALMSEDASDAALIEQRLLPLAMPVGAVHFVADAPNKHGQAEAEEAGTGITAPATQGLQTLISSARHEVLLQTPYLVLSNPAQQMFRQLHDRDDAPRVIVSTNSLAATDSFITYALSYKYKRRYLRDFGFEIHEYKPFPENAPFDLEATGSVQVQSDGNGSVRLDVNDAPQASATDATPARRRMQVPMQQREYSAIRYAGLRVHERIPLQRAGVRVGLHSKSLVIDRRIGVIGTHNFDPRGDNLNTESAVIIADPAFAQLLANSIERDIAPDNAWIIAPRLRGPVLPGLRYSVTKVAEALPVFDLLPIRYATSYQFMPSADCPAPLPPYAPEFHQCHQAVGDFPEAALSVNALLTRIITAFGAGLAPIL